MELNTKGRYAVMALADLAFYGDGGAVSLTQIADRQHLSLAYLEQIFAALRRAGLVESARGRAGGYRLARAASSVSIEEVMSAVDEEPRFTRCHGQLGGCVAGEPCLTHGLWQALGTATSNFLSSVTLADVISQDHRLHDATRTSPRRAYLDYNATAPLRPAARAAMVAAMDVVGNPSSVHSEGREARAILDTARTRVAQLAGAKPSEVVFVSGASEANTWVLSQPFESIFVSLLEHDSILAAAKASTAKLTSIAVNASGTLNLDDLSLHVSRRHSRGRALVSLQLANNETGILQPVQEVAKIAHEHGLNFHADAVQAAGRIALDFATLGADTMSLSSHKIGGPKGVGALIVRDGIDLRPLIFGGGQERRRRAGTENIAAIAGFGAAAEQAIAGFELQDQTAVMRDEMESALREAAPQTVIIGGQSRRLGNTSVVALPGKSAESLVIHLDLAGIAVSAGAACSSGKVGRSHVLDAMGVADDVAKSAIRVSLGAETTREDISAFVAAWKTIASKKALAA